MTIIFFASYPREFSRFVANFTISFNIFAKTLCGPAIPFGGFTMRFANFAMPFGIFAKYFGGFATADRSFAVSFIIFATSFGIIAIRSDNFTKEPEELTKEKIIISFYKNFY